MILRRFLNPSLSALLHLIDPLCGEILVVPALHIGPDGLPVRIPSQRGPRVALVRHKTPVVHPHLGKSHVRRTLGVCGRIVDSAAPVQISLDRTLELFCERANRSAPYLVHARNFDPGSSFLHATLFVCEDEFNAST